MADYDIRKAFEKIENELIASMIRNMEKHREWETDEGFQWEQWQALQLKNLAEYKKRNKKLFGGEFKKINKHLEEAIRKAREEGNMQQELELLKMVRTGRFKKLKITKGMAETNAEFFKMNDRKMDALIQATVSDMEKAETAILRMANDKYRKVIFDAQVYANSGAGTYEKAIDMATRDFLAAGLNCVEYKNGARHTLKDYADMALRTASKRAYLTGEGEKRKEWGIATVIMNKRGNPCPLCLPFIGKVFIDDVWSGGEAYLNGKRRNKKPVEGLSSITGSKYPLLSDAISQGLYHPRCRDSHSTYFEGISTPPDDKFTKEEIKQIEEENKAEAKKQYARRQAEKCERLAEHSLDKDNKKIYREKHSSWNELTLKTLAKSAELNQEFITTTEIPTDIKEQILSVIGELEKDFGLDVGKIEYAPYGENKNAPFTFIPYKKDGEYHVKLNVNRLFKWNESIESFNDRIYQKNYLPGTLASRNMDDLLYHEYIHFLTFGRCQKWDEFVQREAYARSLFIPGISGYSDSSEDGAETIAEAAVKMRNGETVNPKAEILVENLLNYGIICPRRIQRKKIARVRK